MVVKNYPSVASKLKGQSLRLPNLTTHCDSWPAGFNKHHDALAEFLEEKDKEWNLEYKHRRSVKAIGMARFASLYVGVAGYHSHCPLF